MKMRELQERDANKVVLQGHTEKKLICVAGKNDIAVFLLEYLIKKNVSNQFELCVTCNKSETGKNGWQRSLRFFARQNSIREMELSELYDIEELVFISAEYDRLVKPEKFKSTHLFNIHFSLLPAYKGMYTSAMVLLNGEEYTGVTFHRIDKGIDTGEIIAQQKIKIDYEDNCRDVYLKHIDNGTKLLLSNVDLVIEGKEISHPQKRIGSTYYSKKVIDYNNIVIDLNATADSVRNQIRAFNCREYQLPKINGKTVWSASISNIRSWGKPGTIIFENENSMMINTVDYNLIIYYDRLTELLEACRTDDTKSVELLCNIPRLVNAAETEHGWTPLIVAVYNNSLKAVQCLIAAGADIHVKNYNGTNILMYAKDAYIRTGDSRMLTLLSRLGLSPLEKDYGGRNLYDYIHDDELRLKISNIFDSQ